MEKGNQPVKNDSQKRQALLGEEFLLALHRLVKMAKIHQDNNQLLVERIQEFIGILARWCESEGSLLIGISHGRFFLDEAKILYRRENVNIYKEMVRYFEQRKLQGLRFFSELKDASTGHLLSFIRLLNNADKQDDPLTWLVQQLEDFSFPWVEIIKHLPPSMVDHDVKQKEMARRTYSYAVTSIKEVSRKITSQGRVGVRNLKRIVQSMIDSLEKDESILLSMSTVRDYDDYTYTHSVNVAILSLCLGRRIGLSKVSLNSLGICALFHDLGKVEISKDIINKPKKLTDGEFKEIEKHPVRSVSQILKLRASRDLKSKIMLPPFEHHLKYDLSGYPRGHKRKSVSLFGSILTVADVYDAITSPRTYRPTAFSPDQALGMMVDEVGKAFDPILMKIFINMIGIYPAGTLLRLDTGELGIVLGSLEDVDRTRPRIVLLQPDGKGGHKKGEIVNLADWDRGTLSFTRSIDRTFHPSTYGIQAIEYIL